MDGFDIIPLLEQYQQSYDNVATLITSSELKSILISLYRMTIQRCAPNNPKGVDKVLFSIRPGNSVTLSIFGEAHHNPAPVLKPEQMCSLEQICYCLIMIFELKTSTHPIIPMGYENQRRYLRIILGDEIFVTDPKAVAKISITEDYPIKIEVYDKIYRQVSYQVGAFWETPLNPRQRLLPFLFVMVPLDSPDNQN